MRAHSPYAAVLWRALRQCRRARTRVTLLILQLPTPPVLSPGMAPGSRSRRRPASADWRFALHRMRRPTYTTRPKSPPPARRVEWTAPVGFLLMAAACGVSVRAVPVRGIYPHTILPTRDFRASRFTARCRCAHPAAAVSPSQSAQLQPVESTHGWRPELQRSRVQLGYSRLAF